MNSFDPVVILGIAGLAGVGSVIRYLLSKWNGYLHWGILTANVIASFIAGWASTHFTDDTSVALLVVGLAGGLSTFSSWAAGTVHLAAKNKLFAPIAYMLATLILSSTAAYLGLFLG
jgi:CrcB protein